MADLRSIIFSEIQASTNLASISATNLKELPVVMPSKAEHIEILSYIKDEAVRIDALISKIGEAIEKLKEYSAALISACLSCKSVDWIERNSR